MLKRSLFSWWLCLFLLALGGTLSALPTQVQAQTGCSVDLMLALDGSGSIQASDFNLMKVFTRDLVNGFEVGPSDANIGIIQFADTAELYLPLSDDKPRILAAVDNMTQFGNRTDIAGAITLAQGQFGPRRAGIPRVIMVLTDGLHNMSGNPIAQADIARAEGTYILGIAVGDVDLSELISISGGPENVIAVGSFNGLSIILDILLNNTCVLVSLPATDLITPPATVPPANTPTTDPNVTPVATSAALPTNTAVAVENTPVARGPRQTQIAFASDRDGDSEIYVMNADGSNVRQLTTNSADDDKPAWSKDGKHIAFESRVDGNYEIYVMNADGTGLTNLTNNNLDDWGPSWSPDNSKIAFHSNRGGSIDLWVMNSDGSNVSRLTNNGVPTDRSPSWSPDGSQLIFFSDESGGRELYILTIATGEISRLTSNEYYDGHPDWSFTGTQVVFASSRSATNSDVFVMRIDGTEITRLTDDPATDDDPVWSPDGRQIAFETTRGGSYDIWVMNADGTGLVQLTNDPARDWSPDWMWLPE